MPLSQPDYTITTRTIQMQTGATQEDGHISETRHQGSGRSFRVSKWKGHSSNGDGERILYGDNCKPLSPALSSFRGLPGPLGQEEHFDSFSVARACGPGHLRASQTYYCSMSCDSKPLVALRF
ncbi:hypothetical protein EVAR_51863_1 [Eumeta japonica]|uniref:Uncharacterized protein n=1 Tax=Eumeta variegata TaxID=151549 RepID=A0A4C1YNU3_EUMVA|nr:hypothetical protein EVAR_51863_1 [Eumeta japonica]